MSPCGGESVPHQRCAWVVVVALKIKAADATKPGNFFVEPDTPAKCRRYRYAPSAVLGELWLLSSYARATYSLVHITNQRCDP